MELNQNISSVIPNLELMTENDLCKSYMPANSVQGFEGFRVVTLEYGQVLDKCISNAAHLIMMMDGTMKIDRDGVPGYLESTDMYLVPHNAEFKLVGDRQCKLIHFSFYSLPDVIHDYIRSICEESQPVQYNPNSYLEQNHLVRTYLQGIQATLECENNFVLTNRYMKLKAYELFHLLLTTYDRLSLAKFFVPLIKCKTDFRDFLFEHCDKVNSVHELIELSGLSRAKFYRSFNREMGISVYRWMQLQKARAIRDAASEPKMTVSMLRSRFGFVSPGNFVRYCRNFFGCTPLQLIRHSRMGVSVPIVG